MKSNFIKHLNKKVLTALGIFIGILILTQSVRAQELKNSLLWKIEGNGIETSYLFGTFHLLPKADFELKEKVVKAFDKSEQVVMELDMDNPNLQTEMFQNINMSNGQTIESFLSADDFKRLNEYVTANVGFGLDKMNSFKPFFIAAMMMPKMIDGSTASYELAFVQKAKSQEKEIFGLETTAEQAAVFDSISYESQVAELMKMMDEGDEMKSLFNEMISSYKEEDLNSIKQLMRENMSDDNQEKFLLTERNKNWIPRIGEMAKEKSTFFAVGAGHLAGEKGVINLLKTAGYKVKPVM